MDKLHARGSPTLEHHCYDLGLREHSEVRPIHVGGTCRLIALPRVWRMQLGATLQSVNRHLVLAYLNEAQKCWSFR
jgi:hypothetical protein